MGVVGLIGIFLEVIGKGLEKITLETKTKKIAPIGFGGNIFGEFLSDYLQEISKKNKAGNITLKKYLTDDKYFRDENEKEKISQFFSNLNKEIKEKSKNKGLLTRIKEHKTDKGRVKTIISQMDVLNDRKEIEEELSSYNTFKNEINNELQKSCIDLILDMRTFYCKKVLSTENSAIVSLLTMVVGDAKEELKETIIDAFKEVCDNIKIVYGENGVNNIDFGTLCAYTSREIQLGTVECSVCKCSGKRLLDLIRSSVDGLLICPDCGNILNYNPIGSEQLTAIYNEIKNVSNEIKNVSNELSAQRNFIKNIADETFSKAQELLKQCLSSEEFTKALNESHEEIKNKLNEIIKGQKEISIEVGKGNKKVDKVLENQEKGKLESSFDKKMSRIKDYGQRLFPLENQGLEAKNIFYKTFNYCSKYCDCKNNCDYFDDSSYYALWQEYNKFRKFDYDKYNNVPEDEKNNFDGFSDKVETWIVETSEIRTCPKKHNPENKREKAINQPEMETPAPQVSDPTPIGADCIVVCDCGAYVLVNKKDTEISADGYIMRIENDPETNPSDSDSVTTVTNKEHIEIINIFNDNNQLLCPFCGNPIYPTAKFLCDGRNISVKDYKEGKNELIFPNSFYADFKQNGRKGEYKITLTPSSFQKGVFIVPKEYTKIYSTKIQVDSNCSGSLLKIIFMGKMEEVKVKYKYEPFFQIKASKLIEFYNNENSAEQENDIFDDCTLNYSRNHNYLKFKTIKNSEDKTNDKN